MVFERLRRGKKEDTETRSALKYAALVGEAQHPITSQEMYQQLGINVHIIEDDKLIELLERLSFAKNDNDEVEVDKDSLALRVMASKLIRSSWLDPLDSIIGQLEAERLVNRIEMNMNEDEYEYGGTNLLEAFLKLIQTAYSDAKDGRKAKLLKVTPRVFEIGMRETKKKEGGILG